MHQIIRTKNLTWINIYRPQEQDIEYLAQNFKFHDIILNELLKPTLRPKVDQFNNHNYMVLHFPIYDPQKKSAQSKEIDFIFSKKILITAHYEEMEPLAKFIEKIKTISDPQDDIYMNDTGYLIYLILKNMYNFSFRELDHIKKRIDRIEDQIFKGYEKQMVEEISYVKRDIINFRRAIEPQEYALKSFTEISKSFFNQKEQPYFSEMTGSYARIVNLIENNRETIDALEETNNSLLSTKINEIMKRFTILAFTTFPLSLFLAILSLPLKHNPVLEYDYGFWLALSATLILVATMLAIFKKKDWL